MTMYPVWFDKDMLKSMVTRKRKRETDAVAAVEYSEGNVEATTDNTHHTALGMFSVLPEDVIKKIMSHTSSSLKEEVVLRGVCRGFHAMFPESHIEHKWRKVLHSHIFVLYQQEFRDN